jgi:hypothetical protein
VRYSLPWVAARETCVAAENEPFAAEYERLGDDGCLESSTMFAVAKKSLDSLCA